MSTIDLIILGILLKEPQNAFELTKYIEDKNIWRFIKISKPAVYKSCKRLLGAGYLDGKRAKDGEMPEKVIYSVNQKGRERFYELMKHFSENLIPFYFEFNTFLWNIDHLEVKEGLEMLQNVETELKSFFHWIVQHEKQIPSDASFASRKIVKQYRMMLSTLVTWARETITEYKQENQIT